MTAKSKKATDGTGIESPVSAVLRPSGKDGRNTNDKESAVKL